MLAIGVASASVPACGGPSGPTPNSSSSSSTTTSAASTTTTVGEAGFHYVGTFTQPNGTNLPLDLSVFFNLPRAHISASGRPSDIFDVSEKSGYNTGSGGFTGSIRGRFDGTLVNGALNGTFTGTLTANLPGCVAERTYSGPMTREAIAWSPGNHVDTCGGTTPLVETMQAKEDARPPTTSVSSSSTTTSVDGGGGSSSTSTVSSSSTTTIASSTTTSTPTTTTSPTTSTSTTTSTPTTTTTTTPTSTTSTTTSVSTTTSSSSTTTTIQPNCTVGQSPGGFSNVSISSGATGLLAGIQIHICTPSHSTVDWHSNVPWITRNSSGPPENTPIAPVFGNQYQVVIDVAPSTSGARTGSFVMTIRFSGGASLDYTFPVQQNGSGDGPHRPAALSNGLQRQR